MKLYSKPRTRPWKYFFTCALCDGDGKNLGSTSCCALRDDLLGLGFLFNEQSCWMRFLIALLLIASLLFLLFRLISALWKAIGGLLGWTDNSCENLLKKEGNCKKLKKVLKDVRGSSEELVGGKPQIRKTIEEKPKPSHSESQNSS
ncbi:uncharacterized protein LOC103518499 [Diaphorina citri]|uniref:Uncharacterized protein LOC103518499 n=1 Tax=Diaphorina citri TaxID=121845 RepID=A0A1S3DHD7_DIACI|nr:uncharacterized protein LOC103518499 [Diaphorina citri]